MRLLVKLWHKKLVKRRLQMWTQELKLGILDEERWKSLDADLKRLEDGEAEDMADVVCKGVALATEVIAFCLGHRGWRKDRNWNL